MLRENVSKRTDEARDRESEGSTQQTTSHSKRTPHIAPIVRGRECDRKTHLDFEPSSSPFFPPSSNRCSSFLNSSSAISSSWSRTCKIKARKHAAVLGIPTPCPNNRQKGNAPAPHSSPPEYSASTSSQSHSSRSHSSSNTLCSCPST